jgi:prophage DNA circulation protein
MGSITDIHNPWRDALLQASFRAATFHVEAGSKETGRRIVMHEFPKRDLPYAEDMGRRAKTFTIRAYCIAFTQNIKGFPLYSVDYRTPRNTLLSALEALGQGNLHLPRLRGETVVVDHYRMTEEEKLGGYCVFDIDFREFGLPPSYTSPALNTGAALNTVADVIRALVAQGAIPPPRKPHGQT